MTKVGAKHCYCAFCRSPRHLYKRQHIGVIGALYSVFVAALMMFIIFQEFHPSVLGIAAFNAIVAEVFIQIRWRLSIPCPHCGFDPVLYLKNPDKASEKVKWTIETKKKSASFWLADHPLHRLPHRRVRRDAEEKVSLPTKVATAGLSKKV